MNRITIFILLLGATTLAAFAQEAKDKKEGLRKISSGSQENLSIIINESVEIALRGLESLEALDGLEALQSLESLETLEELSALSSLSQLRALGDLERLEKLDFDFKFNFENDFDFHFDLEDGFDFEVDLDIDEIVDQIEVQVEEAMKREKRKN